MRLSISLLAALATMATAKSETTPALFSNRLAWAESTSFIRSSKQESLSVAEAEVASPVVAQSIGYKSNLHGLVWTTVA